MNYENILFCFVDRILLLFLRKYEIKSVIFFVVILGQFVTVGSNNDHFFLTATLFLGEKISGEKSRGKIPKLFAT